MKDSLGKEMPKSISLSEVAIKKGHTVIYSEESRSADIIDERGFIRTIEHN